MLTFKELIDLREKLTKEEITLDRAKVIYGNELKEGKRSWHTKDWKERRNEIIKDSCEICGSSETLTLQHLSHPKKPHEYEREVTSKYNQIFLDSNPSVEKQEFIDHIKNNYDYEPVPLCPKCKSRHPNKRMTKKPQYRCTECKLEFDEPIYKTVEELIEKFYLDHDDMGGRDKPLTSKNKYRQRHSLSKATYWLQREKAKTKYSDTIEKEAFLLYLSDDIKYLSFEDTITACRKCAVNYDLNNMELCPKCKKHYKGVPYPTCINCLPEDKRKAALEKIESGKAWQALHKELGID